jgi:hypothetical protein
MTQGYGFDKKSVQRITDTVHRVEGSVIGGKGGRRQGKTMTAPSMVWIAMYDSVDGVVRGKPLTTEQIRLNHLADDPYSEYFPRYFLGEEVEFTTMTGMAIAAGEIFTVISVYGGFVAYPMRDVIPAKSYASEEIPSYSVVMLSDYTNYRMNIRKPLSSEIKTYFVTDADAFSIFGEVKLISKNWPKWVNYELDGEGNPPLVGLGVGVTNLSYKVKKEDSPEAKFICMSVDAVQERCLVRPFVPSGPTEWSQIESLDIPTPYESTINTSLTYYASFTWTLPEITFDRGYSMKELFPYEYEYWGLNKVLVRFQMNSGLLPSIFIQNMTSDSDLLVRNPLLYCEFKGEYEETEGWDQLTAIYRYYGWGFTDYGAQYIPEREIISPSPHPFILPGTEDDAKYTAVRFKIMASIKVEEYETLPLTVKAGITGAGFTDYLQLSFRGWNS